MSITRVSPKHQITIPKPIIEEVRLEVGDVLDAVVHNGKIILTPKRTADRTGAIQLTAAERKILIRAKSKIERIQNDLPNSKGLTRKETSVAVKAGLIAEDQAYFWEEEWQKNERASERAIQCGKTSPAYENANDALAYLHHEASKI